MQIVQKSVTFCLLGYCFEKTKLVLALISEASIFGIAALNYSSNTAKKKSVIKNKKALKWGKNNFK